MANSQGIGVQFKNECMAAMLDGATIKAALYLASATVSAATDAYTATGEVSGTGYTAGGVTITNGNAVADNGTSTAYWTPSASITYTGVTLATAFDAVLLYIPAATPANLSIGVFTFGSQTVDGNFTLTMPTNDATNALVRFA